jgi:hypothetical protein
VVEELVQELVLELVQELEVLYTGDMTNNEMTGSQLGNKYIV